jgi:NTE family protein
LVCPEVSNTISFMDWSRHSELFSDAYDRTTRWIEEQNDSGLRAVLGTAHD